MWKLASQIWWISVFVPTFFFYVVQAILSSVKLCLSSSEVDCFCTLWNETFLHSFSCILHIQQVCISLNINFYPPYTFGGYIVFWLLIFCKFFELNRCFTWKMDSNVCVCLRHLLVPIIYEHRDCCTLYWSFHIQWESCAIFLFSVSSNLSYCAFSK
jgi:hypothetical protein